MAGGTSEYGRDRNGRLNEHVQMFAKWDVIRWTQFCSCCSRTMLRYNELQAPLWVI